MKERNRSLLAMITTIALAVPAYANQPNLIVAQADSRPLGPRAQAMLDALMEVMGVSGQPAQQQIIGILIGYRAGDIAPTDAIRQLNQLAANGFWGTETVNEIIARVRVAQALTGDWNGDGRFDRVQAIAFLVAAGDSTRRAAFADADVEALLALMDRGEVDAATAIDRLSRFGGTEPFPFMTMAENNDMNVSPSLQGAVIDVFVGGDGDGDVRRDHVEAAIMSIMADPMAGPH